MKRRVASPISEASTSSRRDGSGLTVARQKGLQVKSPFLPFHVLTRKVFIGAGKAITSRKCGLFFQRPFLVWTLAAVLVVSDMPLDISTNPTRQDIFSIFFADPFKPCVKGNRLLGVFRRIGFKPSPFRRRGTPDTHQDPIRPEIAHCPRFRPNVRQGVGPRGELPKGKPRVRAKPFGVPRVPHLPHDPSFHCRGYILTHAKRFARTPFLLGFAARMDPHRKSPALVNIQDPHRAQSVKRGGRCLARSGGVVAKSSGVYFMASKGNHLVKFPPNPRGNVRLHLGNFGGVGKNPRQGVTLGQA